MALSIRLHTFQISSSEVVPVTSHRFGAESAAQDRFLSSRDRQYIKALVVMGYRDEATRLVHRAYAKRKRDREAAAAREREKTGRPTLFTRFDVDYLEMLALVGDRRTALDLFLRAIDDYELESLRNVIPALGNQIALEMEYREAIRAIEAGFPLSKAVAVQKPPTEPRPATHSFLGRLFKFLFPTALVTKQIPTQVGNE